MGILIRIVLVAILLSIVVRVLRKLLVGPQQGATDYTGNVEDLDPYVVLGVSSSSTDEEIKAAYRSKLAEYHPDKAAHLGSDLQKLAVLRTQQINWAYTKLK